MSDFFVSTFDNQQFLKEIKALTSKIGYKLNICEPVMNRGDRWIQVRTFCRLCLTANCGEMLTH